MMTRSSLSDFANRLRQFMARSGSPETRPNCEVEDEFNTLALELHSLQWALNAPYRSIATTRTAAPGSVSHWTEIPAAPTSAFKALELTCLPPTQHQAVFCSSGTTGQQTSRHVHSAESLALYETSSWTWFRVHLAQDWTDAGSDLQETPTTHCGPARAGASNAARSKQPHLVVLTPGAGQAPRSSLVHMFETIRRRVGAAATRFCGTVERDGSWSLDVAQAEAALESALRAECPVLLLGTAFNYVQCLDHWSGSGRRFALPSGSRVLETGGYKGRSRTLPKEELHGQLGASLGVPPGSIISEYGMSELSSQAYDGVADRLDHRDERPRRFRFPSWARAQVVSPETGREVADGETGLLRIFDLANVWSVLAVQTEDLGTRRGDAFELIGRAAKAEPRGCSLMVG